MEKKWNDSIYLKKNPCKVDLQGHFEKSKLL